MGFKAAIFDLDGTLLDSMGVWERIDVVFLERRNMTVPKTYSKEICTLGFREAAQYTIERFGLIETVEEVMKEWNDMAIHEYGCNVKLKPYAKEYVTRLKENGIKLGTATSLSRTLSEPVLRRNGIYDLFDAQCFTDEVQRGKEYPDIYLLASRKLEVKPNECIVFEDLLPGIVSAKRAGMEAYCVWDAFSKEHEDEILKVADGYISDFLHAPLGQR